VALWCGVPVLPGGDGGRPPKGHRIVIPASTVTPMHASPHCVTHRRAPSPRQLSAASAPMAGQAAPAPPAPCSSGPPVALRFGAPCHRREGGVGHPWRLGASSCLAQPRDTSTPLRALPLTAGAETRRRRASAARCSLPFPRPWLCDAVVRCYGLRGPRTARGWVHRVAFRPPGKPASAWPLTVSRGVSRRSPLRSTNRR
jgi:hypothetical protein